MKKVISLFLAAVMVTAMLVVPSTAAQSNVDANVDYFATAPTLDGVISAEEWGASTVTVKGSEAQGIDATAVNALNTYIQLESGYEAYADQLEYTLWLRWDNDNFYIGAQVKDPDGYNLKSGNANIWNGDCLQFRVDKYGPNSAMSYADKTYDYKTTPFDSVTYKTPWSFQGETINAGVGQVNGMSAPSAYEMQNKFKMKTVGIGLTKAANPGDTTTYEVQVPWNIIDTNFGTADANILGQYNQVLGMAVCVLNASAQNGDARNGDYNSFLNWGSGITGGQPSATCGGSNAIKLTNINAVDGTTVEGLTEYKGKDVGPVDHVDQYMYADIACTYAQTHTDYFIDSAETGYASTIDICFLGAHPVHPEYTSFGFWVGSGYSCYAGYDYTDKKFMIAGQSGESGFSKGDMYGQSEGTFEWKLGDWHELGIKLVGNTIELYCDTVLVVSATNDKFNMADLIDRQTEEDGTLEDGAQCIFYNISEILFDNWTFAKTNYDIKTKTGDTYFKFTFDTDDEVYNASKCQLLMIQNKFIRTNAACGEVEIDGVPFNVGHNWKLASVSGNNANMKCQYSDDTTVWDNTIYKFPATTIIGDVNSDGVVNSKDVTRLLQYLAEWDVVADLAAADANADTNVNSKDVTRLLQYLAGWDVKLGA